MQPTTAPPLTAGQLPTAGNTTQTRKVLKSLGYVLAGALLVVMAKELDFAGVMERGLSAIEGLGFWAPVLFILLYVVATVFFIPASALTLGAGAVFGVGLGTAYVSVASTAGAALAFLVGRHFARERVASKLVGNKRFTAVDEAVAQDGWKIVALTRLSPIFPFGPLNYAFGLTKVKFGHYVLASWVGMLPGTLMYVYFGSLGQAVAGAQGRTPGQWAVLLVGLLATVAVTIFVTRIAKRALAQRMGEGQA